MDVVAGDDVVGTVVVVAVVVGGTLVVVEVIIMSVDKLEEKVADANGSEVVDVIVVVGTTEIEESANAQFDSHTQEFSEAGSHVDLSPSVSLHFEILQLQEIPPQPKEQLHVPFPVRP